MMHALSLGKLFFPISKLVQQFQYPVFIVSPLIKKILVDEVGKMSLKGLGSCDVNDK